jgi:hypothetical protein
MTASNQNSKDTEQHSDADAAWGSHVHGLEGFLLCH